MPRPKSFDPETALDRAMDVFRVKGYDGASISDLTAAMGINRFSLYDTFGDKHALYMSALDRYERCAIDPLIERLDETVSVDALETFFDALAEHAASSGSAPCCLLHRTACADASGDDEVRVRVTAMRSRVVDAYRSLAERLVENNELNDAIDPEHAAWALFTIQSGIVSYATAPPSMERIGSAVRLVLASMRPPAPVAGA